MPELTEYERNTLSRIAELYESGKLSNEFLIQNIELCGAYLNLMTISDYSRENKISYNGAKKFRNVRKFFGVKFVIDND